MKWIRKKTYYAVPVVHEFNLPAGWSCPGAKDCKVKANRETGKMDITGTKYRCYAAMSERFPAVRDYRWSNYNDVLAGVPIWPPTDATHVRIHASGDFFNQQYFDQWLQVCRDNPDVHFWAFTKSVGMWCARLGEIPENLVLQASRGGMQDHLIDIFDLKFAEVFPSEEAAAAAGLPVDTDDSLAMSGTQSFALLDNFRPKRNKNKPIDSCPEKLSDGRAHG